MGATWEEMALENINEVATRGLLIVCDSSINIYGSSDNRQFSSVKSELLASVEMSSMHAAGAPVV